jgi:hypothetical protein
MNYLIVSWAFLFLIFSGKGPKKIKKDVASIPNAVAKGTPKSIPKKVLLVNLSCVIFITLALHKVIKVYL